jgi:hypothetical protein
MVLLSLLAVVKCGVASGCPAFMGGLSLYCTDLLYQPTMLKTSQILALTKYRRPPKIHLFSPNYGSPNICSQASYPKVVKTKSDHHYCPIKVFILTTSELEAVLEILRYGL